MNVATAVMSIVMINRNEGRYAGRAVASLRQAIENSAAGARCEVIFVDNGSTDNSVADALHELNGASFKYECVHEEERGVNAARIAGYKNARGRFIVFMDSDVLVKKGWCDALFQAFNQYPDVRVFAGRILVGDIEGAVPRWLDLAGVYSRPSIVVRCDNGDTECCATLDDSRVQGPAGPNMAFERSVFDEYGMFDTSFGLRPGSLVPGAEAEYFHRLSKYGERFVYVPGACVHHPFKCGQLSKSYFRRRLYGIGKVCARLQRRDGLAAKRICGVSRFRLRELLAAWCRYAGSWLQRCPKRRFFLRGNISFICGQIAEERMVSQTERLNRKNAASSSSSVNASGEKVCSEACR